MEPLFNSADFVLLDQHGGKSFNSGDVVSKQFKDLYKRFKSIGDFIRREDITFQAKSWQNSGNALDYIWAKITPFSLDTEKQPHCMFLIFTAMLHIRMFVCGYRPMCATSRSDKVDRSLGDNM